MSLGDDLKNVVVNFSNKMKTENQIFKKAETGELRREQVGLYLFNVYFLLAQAKDQNRSAALVSKERGIKSLESFFNTLVELEDGNDTWAVNDLSDFGFDEMFVEKFYVTPAMEEYAKFVQEIAEKRPHSYAAYHYLSANIALNAGAEWLNLLQLNCGISMSEITVLSRYQLLDNEYNINDFNLVDHFDDGLDTTEVLEDLNKSFNYLFKFLNEVSEGTL